MGKAKMRKNRQEIRKNEPLLSKNLRK